MENVKLRKTNKTPDALIDPKPHDEPPPASSTATTTPINTNDTNRFGTRISSGSLATATKPIQTPPPLPPTAPHNTAANSSSASSTNHENLDDGAKKTTRNTVGPPMPPVKPPKPFSPLPNKTNEQAQPPTLPLVRLKPVNKAESTTATATTQQEPEPSLIKPKLMTDHDKRSSVREIIQMMSEESKVSS